MGEFSGRMGVSQLLADADADKQRTKIQQFIEPQLFIGTIHDVFSHTGAYIVRVPGGRTRMGVMLAEVSDTPLGAREIRHLQIGDAVMCASNQQESWIYIMGAVPAAIYDPRFVVPDSLVMRSMVGILQDQMHNSPYAKEKNDLANFSGGRPLDTLEGDWGFINELGVAVWLGKLMTQMRASDIAKMEMFWGDDLVRLFGWNFELFTGGRESRHYDDEGEYIEIDRWTPYGWESLGAYEHGEEIFEDNEGDSGGAERGNEKSRYEPKEATQVMVFRGQTLRGYIGNGIRDQLVAVPPDGTGLSKPDDEKLYRGLSEIHQDIDGSVFVRSAKQVILEKSLIMPVPRQKKDPDDPSGDTGTGDNPNYNPAGVYGTGVQEREPYIWDDELRPDARNTDLWDYQAYLFGKYGLNVLDDHEEDWTTPNASELKIDDSENSEVDKELFTPPLDFQYVRNVPESGLITIDQRVGHTVRYYKTRSCFQLSDDGSVIIEDGYGSQIHMSGGNINITCQGDVVTRPGRSAVTWAPRDIINKAGWCNEMSASKGDVRVQGSNNVHVLAGDDTSGSLLLECRAKNKPSRDEWNGSLGSDIVSSGIIIKAPESAIDIWSKSVFAGTHKDESGRVEINAGDFGRVVISADEIGNEALSKFGALVSPSRSSGTQLNMEPGGKSRLISSLDVVGNFGAWEGSYGVGNITMDGTIHAGRNARIAGVIETTSLAAEAILHAGGIHVGESPVDGPDAPESEGSSNEAEAESFRSDVYTEFNTVTIANPSNGAGTKALQDAIGFSFRTSRQYKTDADDFIVFESRWQQLYRVHGSLVKWEDPEVDSPEGTPTRPHPGNDSWKGSGHYKYSSTQPNVTLTTGVAKDRSEQTAEEAALTAGSLLSDYVINIQEEG